MTSLRKQDYLMELREHLGTQGYHAEVQYKRKLGEGDLYLLAQKNQDLLHIGLDLGEKGIFDKYKLSLRTSDLSLLTDLAWSNTTMKARTRKNHINKRNFNNKLGHGILELQENIGKYRASYERNASSLENKIPLFTEKLGTLDVMKPAIGLEMNADGMHPIFGAVIGNSEKLLLYDPFDTSAETNGYIGFSNASIRVVKRVAVKKLSGRSPKGVSESRPNDASEVCFYVPDAFDCIPDILGCHTPGSHGCDIFDISGCEIPDPGDCSDCSG